MNPWLLGAALLSGGTALVHTFLGGPDVATPVLESSALFAAWSGVLVTWKRTSPWLLPQWALFLPIAAVGTAGVVCV